MDAIIVYNGGTVPPGIVGLLAYVYDSLTDLIDDACEILNGHRWHECTVVLSEIAVENITEDDPAAKMTRWLDEIVAYQDKIDHVYWFTHYPDSPHGWDDTNNSRFWHECESEDGYCQTATGKALYDYVHYP
jgi:hypothetical protein